MYQSVLPFFPSDTTMINANLGFKKVADTVYYFHQGKPINCHQVDDKRGFEFVVATLVRNGACKGSEISKAMGIGYKNVYRYCKKLREEGAEAFFAKSNRKGDCYRFTDELHSQAQHLLDEGFSVYKTAQKTGLSEGALRYHIKRGTLKKTPANQKLKATRNP